MTATNELARLQEWGRIGLALHVAANAVIAMRYPETIIGDAQAIEARRAETQSGSVHESAVRQDAPEAARTPPPETNHEPG